MTNVLNFPTKHVPRISVEGMNLAELLDFAHLITSHTLDVAGPVAGTHLLCYLRAAEANLAFAAVAHYAEMDLR